MLNSISSETPEILIDVRDVSYTHWNQTEPTLRDVSLQIRRDSFNVLVGPSGSGKSTLCDLFNGVTPHLQGGRMEGVVLVNGTDTRETKVSNLAQMVGRVFQDPETMFATLYVEDEIAFGPENLRTDVQSILATVEELLDLTELAAHRKNLVWNLSGGQIQKLGLATVLAMRPQMIVLDEPTSNLDPAATKEVHDLLRSLPPQGITVVLVTRELDEFLAGADQLLVMEAGRIYAAGPPREVLNQHGVYMANTLGLWLPETSETGIGLQQAGLLAGEGLPISVEETVELFARHRLLDHDLLVEADPPAQTAGTRLLVQANDLKYSYPGGTPALDRISLDVHAGEWLMIVGRNGAGKSTLANMLVGLLRPQSGSLQILGRDAAEWKVQDLANHISLVFQNPEHQFLTDRVSDEIGYSLVAQGISDPTEMEQRTEDLMRQLGLEQVRNIHPFALNAGLKRRLGVATMLVGKPQILLVDEPTYGQDKGMTHTLMALMEEIRAKGIAVVMITHDMRLVQEYAGRVIVMSRGAVLYDGPSSGLFGHDELLMEANLRRTTLHNLLAAMEKRGSNIRGNIRRTEDLVRLLSETQGAG